MFKSKSGYLLLLILFIIPATTLFSQEAFICKFGQNNIDVSNAATSALPENKFNIIYADCRWNLDPAINYISGSVDYYFLIINSPSDTFYLDLANPMNVDSVIYQGNRINYLHQDNVLSIIFPQLISPGIIDSVIIYYQGAPVATGNGSFEITTHSGVPAMYTLSEPYGARDWWPCRQDQSDKIDSISINVTSPITYRTASNGIIISEDSDLISRTCHWKSNYPIAPYLVAIAVTNYSVYSDKIVLSNGDSLLILNYIYPESITQATGPLSEVGDIIHLYDSLTIPYPFSKEKYGNTQFNWGGGIEHQTMSFIGNFSEELIAHECAHQWFGDDVTCESWHDIWLHEGFATYFAALVLEKYHPAEWTDWLRGNLSKATLLNDGSVYCDDTVSISRIFNGTLSYQRAARLLDMLRWKLGDTAFFSGIKNYLMDNSLNYSFANTDDLKNHFQQSSGLDLNQFFSEWYYGEGFPVYDISWKNNADVFELDISQSASDGSPSFFHIPVPVKLSNDVHDTIIVIDPSYSPQTFNFNLGFTVSRVEFDPASKILARVGSVLEKIDGDNLIDIFPSVVKDHFTIYSKRNDIRITELIIFNSIGQIVFQEYLRDNLLKYEVPLPELTSGNYSARILTDDGPVTRAITVIK